MNALGVAGMSGSSGNAGVGGLNNTMGPGVVGNSMGGGAGVVGTSSNGSGMGSYGVYGQATGSTGGIGVLGSCSNDANSVGMYGQSATGKGFLGFSGSVNGVGATGVNTTTGIGLYGVSSGGYAGVFSGNVYVTGALTVAGAKSAAVRGAGGLQRVYSVESPESWFEDFGSGELSSGSATVSLEPGFAAIVSRDYRVFLTPLGESNSLYVSSKSGSGFAVHESNGGKSNVGFDYRVVARRRDIAGGRLERVDAPALPGVPSLLIEVPGSRTPPAPPH
jgi:hypothetical protein